jgi:hypothetical protein
MTFDSNVIFMQKQFADMLMGNGDTKPPSPCTKRGAVEVFNRLGELQSTMEKQNDIDNSLYRAIKSARIHMGSVIDLYR